MLGGALVALVAGLAATALWRFRGAEGSSILGDLLGDRFGNLLTQLAFWTAVAALLVVIATALIALAREGSRARGVGRRPVPTIPEVERPHQGTADLRQITGVGSVSPRVASKS